MIARRIDILALVLLLIFTVSQPAGAADLHVFTEEYPPVTFTQNGTLTGLASEVVMEIQRRIGDKTVIEVVPWARGYKMVTSQPNVALFATMRTAERESLFKWVGPLTTVNTSFYARSGNPVQVASLEDAKTSQDLLVPNAYYSHQFLVSRGFKDLYATNSPEAMARMLIGNRSQLMATDNLTLAAILDKVGAKTSDVRLVYTFMTSQNYVAFSIGTPDQTVRQWQQALNQMKRDGSFARIYKKWLPDETPPGIEPSPEWVEGAR